MAPHGDRGSPGRGAAKRAGAAKTQHGATAGTTAPAWPGLIMNLLVMGTAKLAADRLAAKIGLYLDKGFQLTEPTRLQWGTAGTHAKPASGGYVRMVSAPQARRPERSAERAASRRKAPVRVAGGEVQVARTAISLDGFTAQPSVDLVESERRVAVVDLTPVARPAVGAKASADSKLLAESLDRIRELRRKHPSAAVLALVETAAQHVIAQALAAGADEILLTDDMESDTRVSARVQTAIARAANRADTTVRESPSAAPSEDELTAALAQVDDLAGKRLTVEQRAERAASAGNDVLAIVAPALRDRQSGRLDAKRIAKRLGVSVAALAQAIGKQRQTVNKTPDAEDLQPALAPMARVVSLLEDALAPNELTAWLSSSHEGLRGATPRSEILAGRASRVALMLESALGGGA